ncbi:M48 family metallopeptidase [bacterium]|nr:M48 family metallopeptidase [Akkermansiaceae bacterium]MDB4485599.1 M48 family metallopeptidase [bacterium]MDB4577198.1 M48 family metallopeptidase [bacterium]
MAPASQSIQQAGREAFDEHRKKTPVSTDSYARSRVNRVANRLKPVVNLPGTSWEFEVFNDSSANAFAVPGGKVGVNTGLLKVAVTDGQLAAVLAHEMAHVTSNHAQARIQNSQNIAVGSAILEAVLGSESGLGQLAPKVGNIAFGLTFSRAQELEADKVGTIFMARAGYNPEDAVELWKRMAAQGGGGTPEFLSTHPVSSTRIKALQDFLPQAKAQQR